MTHPDLPAEQAHLDRIYARLDAEIDATRRRLTSVRGQRVGGLHQARFEREAFAGHLEDRLSALLAQRRDDLCFGRIDMASGEVFYIGRLGLADEHQEPLLIDWRAPAAAPFYQATPAAPLRVVRRRHFLTRARQIVSIEDEVLDAEHADDLLGETGTAGLRGEAALQYAMNQARTGRMREVAATLQREQDEIIRAPLSPALFVQGGPGTGKTAVALHRAAYLLYTYRQQLSADDVLVVGPNPLFLRYIEHVLPSLGESGVGMASTAGIYRTRDWAPEPEPARSIKARPVMVDVIARAIATRERPLPRPVEIALGGERIAVRPADTRRIVRAARERPGRHNPKAAYVHGRLANLIWRRGGKEAVGDLMEYEDFREEMFRDRTFHRITARMWPLLSPEDLLGPVFGFPALLREATTGLLDPDEAAALEREWDPDAGPDEAGWTDVDAALLDEAERQLGPVPAELDPARRRGGDRDVDPFADEERRAEAEYAAELTRGLGGGMVSADTIRSRYGGGAVDRDDEFDEHDAAGTTRLWRYAVVDEAQDLSAMQWRMVGRHCPRRILTVVGDLAQGTEAWSANSWDDVADALALADEPRVAELTINYRTPSEVSDYAARILARLRERLDGDLAPPEAVRSVPGSFTSEHAAPADLVALAGEAARKVMDELGEGIVAVIGLPDLADRLRDIVEAACGLELPVVGSSAMLDAPVTVVPPALAKGLEFDGVVLVDPDGLAAEAGLHALYVTATRATRRLHVLHTGADPVPATESADG